MLKGSGQGSDGSGLHDSTPTLAAVGKTLRGRLEYTWGYH